ncbi:MAG: type II secretion system protein N [Succinivibrionaceae bacterium]
MKKAVIVLVTILFLVLGMGWFILTEAPAGKVLALTGLPPGISLSGVKGTIVNGQSRILRIRNYEYRNLKWQTSLWGLLAKSAQVSISDPQGLNGRSRISYDGSGTISLENTSLRLSLVNLLKYTRYQLPVDVSGWASLQLTKAEFTPEQCLKAQGKAELNSVVVMTAMGNYNLGNVQLELNCRNGKFIARTKHNNPYFSLEGNLEYDMKSRKYSVKAFAKPDDASGNEVQLLLDMLGKANSTGTYEINYQGIFNY